MTEKSESSVDLYWLPLGAGGHFVRLNGRFFEGVTARLERRPTRDLYHSALAVRVPDGKFVIEMAPISDWNGALRGVVAEGPVGSRWARSLRILRYENRRWRDGVIPDVAEAVESPQRLTDDPVLAQRVLDLVPRAPTPAWGRDERHAGEMWNSNSLISWLLERSGIGVEAVRLPARGRALGWSAGVVVARRSAAAATSTDLQGAREIGDRQEADKASVVEDERSAEIVFTEPLERVCEVIVGGDHRDLIEPKHAVPDKAPVPLAPWDLGDAAEGQEADGVSVVHNRIGREAP
jgi:hypothetical protein